MNFAKELKYLVRKVIISGFIKSKSVPALKQLALVRKTYGIQIDPEQLREIIQAVKPPINFLVFGLGNDSGFWMKRNANGRTVFVEDDPIWFQKIKKRHPAIEAYLVNYDTKLTDSKRLLNEPHELKMNLPPAISDTKWDVILIDGPAGDKDDKPGRMKPIYAATQLIKPGGDIFLHDCNRQVEQQYSKKFFGDENLVSEIGSEILRHYRISTQ